MRCFSYTQYVSSIDSAQVPEVDDLADMLGAVASGDDVRSINDIALRIQG